MFCESGPDLVPLQQSAKVVIPFAALSECAAENRAPVSGEYYRVNFSRVQWKVDIKEGAFAKRLDKETGLRCRVL